MTKSKRIRLIYGIALSIALVTAGICLCAACLGIYLAGDRAFSREAVARSFSGIAVPVYLALVMVVVGFILDFTLPKETKKQKPGKNYAGTLQRLWQKRDLNNCEESLKPLIVAEQRRRKLHTARTLLLLAVFSFVFLFYAVQPKHFPTADINSAMIKATCLMLICLVIPFGYAVFTAYVSNKSMEKEIEYVKQIPPTAVSKPPKAEPAAVLRWVLLGISAVILLYGYFSGGTLDVLTKAINICTECVGLG